MHLRRCFFDSLQDHEFEATNSVITFKDSELKVFVHDILSPDEWVAIPNITRLLSFETDVFTVYYHKDEMEKLDQANIRGIQEYREDNTIKEICSLKRLEAER